MAPKEVTCRGWTILAIVALTIAAWAGMLAGVRTLVSISAIGLLIGMVVFIAFNLLVGRKVREAGYDR